MIINYNLNILPLFSRLVAQLIRSILKLEFTMKKFVLSVSNSNQIGYPANLKFNKFLRNSNSIDF